MFFDDCSRDIARTPKLVNVVRVVGAPRLEVGAFGHGVVLFVLVREMLSYKSDTVIVGLQDVLPIVYLMDSFCFVHVDDIYVLIWLTVEFPLPMVDIVFFRLK